MNTVSSDRTGPDDVHTLAGAYALHALEEQEDAAFESHLLRCPGCRAELAEFRATAAILAAAAAASVPTQLKQRVMAAVSRTRQQPPPVQPVSEQRRALRHRATLGRIRPSRRLLAAAAGIVLLVAAGLGGMQAFRLQQAADQREQIAAVLAAPDAHSVDGAVAGGGRVTLVVSQREQRSVVILDKLPPTPANRTYQMWLIHNRTPRSAGTFDITASERTTRILTTPADTHVDGFGLTVEPHGGSRTPTPPVLVELPLR